MCPPGGRTYGIPDLRQSEQTWSLTSPGCVQHPPARAATNLIISLFFSTTTRKPMMTSSIKQSKKPWPTSTRTTCKDNYCKLCMHAVKTTIHTINTGSFGDCQRLHEFISLRLGIWTRRWRQDRGVTCDTAQLLSPSTTTAKLLSCTP